MTSTTPPTERVGRYQLLEPIGIGPSGSVSRAKVFGVAGFERQFAVKRFHAELTATAAMAAMLSAAARAYGSLEHPRIARMSEFGVAQGATFTAVEYVLGLDALRLIGEAKLAGITLAAGGALALVSQAARAVGYAHGRGLTHLGLAPTNVIVTAEGDIKITDFGILSATLPSRPIEAARLTQRIPYLAPEQLANEATSAATDVFALGVLAYELVTGTRTFRGDTPQQVASAIMAGPPAEPPLPRPIVRVLQRCLARSPFERFPDARALADALDAALRVAPVPGTRKDIGAQVKDTLDRLAALNDGQMSGMVALHLGTGPIRRISDDEVRAPALGREPQPRDPSEMLTYELQRPDLADGNPSFASAGSTVPDLPRPITTVPGLPPPPIPVPPGLGPPAIPPTPAAGSNTLLGIGKPPAIPPIKRPGSATGLPARPPAVPPAALRPGSRTEQPIAIEPPAIATQRDATTDSAIHTLDPSDVLALDDMADDDPTRPPSSPPFGDDFQDAPTHAIKETLSGRQPAVEPPPDEPSRERAAADAAAALFDPIPSDRATTATAAEDEVPTTPARGGSGRVAVPAAGTSSGRIASPTAGTSSGRIASPTAGTSSGRIASPTAGTSSGRIARADASPDASAGSGRISAPAASADAGSGRSAAPDASAGSGRISAPTASTDAAGSGRVPAPEAAAASGPDASPAVDSAPLATSGLAAAPGDVPAVTDLPDLGRDLGREPVTGRTMIGVAAPTFPARSARPTPAPSPIAPSPEPASAWQRPMGDTQPEDVPPMPSGVDPAPVEPRQPPPGWITPPPLAGPSPITPLAAPARRRPLWIAVGALGAAGLAFGAWQLYERSSAPTPARPSTPHPVAAAPADAASPDAPRVAVAPPADAAPADASHAVDAGKLAAAPADAAAPDAPRIAAALDAGVADARPAPADAGQVAASPPPVAASGELVIASTPPGAHVFLDGADTGTTPVKLPGSPDRHNLALVLANHELYVAQVDGHGSFQIPLKEVTPANGPAGIKVLRCKPDRYYVFVDGKPTGQTCPTERIGCEVGPHTVEVYDVVSETRRKWDIVVKDTRLSFRVRVD